MFFQILLSGSIFYKRQTSDSEWQRVVQRVIASNNKWQNWQWVLQQMAASDNEWQQITVSDNKWQTISDNEWQQEKEEAILQ